MTRLLLVEDDPTICRPLTRALDKAGYEVTHRGDGAGALEVVAAGEADIVLLDLGLPDMDGFDVCQRIRDLSSDLPVVMLTARTEEVDLLVGFDVGADDYITKPFRVAELLARLAARVRLSSPGARSVIAGGLRLDGEARQVWVGDEEVSLTRTEFSLLEMLAERVGRAVPRLDLIEAVWGHVAPSSRSIDMHMSSLRKKLAAVDGEVVITTVRGTGFRLEAEPGDR